LSKLLIVFWLVLLAALSLAPFEVKQRLGTNGRFHQLGHVATFALTGLIVCWTAASIQQRLWRLAAICCFAVCMEALETAIYRNGYEWRDVGLDAAGAALGALFAIIRTLCRPTRYSSGTNRTA
jgi:VanZ family protein